MQTHDYFLNGRDVGENEELSPRKGMKRKKGTSKSSVHSEEGDTVRRPRITGLILFCGASCICRSVLVPLVDRCPRLDTSRSVRRAGAFLANAL
jgi:hypothetical protein